MDGHTTRVQCPWCFESMETWFEIDISGELIQDCEVCCHPWVLVVRNGEIVSCERE